MRPILLVGGAPRVPVDAVRYLMVTASGVTALAIERRLRARSLGADLLLGADAAPGVPARRYPDRAHLELELRAWISAHREGVVVMSAAVNDYEVAGVESRRGGGAPERLAPGAKLASGAEEVLIRLRPAGKVIDQLRGWGLAGPIVGFKYEGRDTVLASAEALRRRVGAAAVVANSICGTVQALVQEGAPASFRDREALLDALADELARLAET
jgi:hypothetical protein